MVPWVPWYPQILADGDKLCPTNYYWHLRIFRPSDGLDCISIFRTFFDRVKGKKNSFWDFLTFILDWRGRPLFGLCVLFGHFEVAFSKSAQISCLLLFDEISCLFVLKFEILWLRLRDWSADWSSAKKQNGSVTINWRLTIFKLSIIKRNNRGRNCSLQIWNCN